MLLLLLLLLSSELTVPKSFTPSFTSVLANSRRSLAKIQENYNTQPNRQKSDINFLQVVNQPHVASVTGMRQGEAIHIPLGTRGQASKLKIKSYFKTNHIFKDPQSRPASDSILVGTLSMTGPIQRWHCTGHAISPLMPTSFASYRANPRQPNT